MCGCRCFHVVPARLVLYFLSLTCVIVTFLLRSVINISILTMVKENNVSASHYNNTNKLCLVSGNDGVKYVNYGGTLDWSMNEQYYILTTFFWTYIVSQVFGAVIAQRYGSKVVTGLATLISSLANMCIPMGSEIHYGVVIFFQLMSGFAQGLIWPAIYGMISWWIPLDERSRFVSCFQGLIIGVALSHLQSGYVIAYFGWKYAFYASGVLGIIWCVCWYFLAFNTPELHPRISLNELNYIKQNRDQVLSTIKQTVPWLSILCSIPLWAIAVASFGRVWIHSTVVVYGPMYLKTVIGLEVQKNGLASFFISFGCFFWAIFISYVSDKVESNKLVATVVNRRITSGIGAVLPCILCLLINNMNCNVNTILVVWGFIQIFLTSNFIGTMVNIVDIAPNLSGPATSFVQVVSLLPNILSTFVTKSYLKKESTSEAWEGVFYTAAGVMCISYLLYIIFVSTKVQEWDVQSEPIKATPKDDKWAELQILTK